MVFLCTGIYVPFKGPALSCNPAWSEYTFFFPFLHCGRKKERKRWDCIGGRAASSRNILPRSVVCFQIFFLKRVWEE